MQGEGCWVQGSGFRTHNPGVILQEDLGFRVKS